MIELIESEFELGDLSLTEIVDLDILQHIQDAFASLEIPDERLRN